MSKIPTAEEFYKQTTGCVMNHRDVKTAMIEFAKLHVEAALKEAEIAGQNNWGNSKKNERCYFKCLSFRKC